MMGVKVACPSVAGIVVYVNQLDDSLHGLCILQIFTFNNTVDVSNKTVLRELYIISTLFSHALHCTGVCLNFDEDLSN